MKLYIKNIWIVFVFVICAELATGQQIILKSDTISYGTDSVATLVLPDYRGELNWQVSYDQEAWSTLPNELKDSLEIDLDIDAWYRSMIIEGSCDTIYSDTTEVIISDSLREHYQSIVLPVAYPDEPGEIVDVFFNNDTITCRKVNDEYVFQGDMILTEKQVMQLNDNKGASIPTDDMFLKLWPEATVYYTIGSGFEGDSRIAEAIQHWESRTPIKFEERENEENFVEFTLVNEGCFSNTGMIGGKQVINISKDTNGWKAYDVSHEIGHTIGLFHEHSRSDRDDYIKIIEKNMKTEQEKRDYRIIENSINYGEFDFKSIMLYPPCIGSSFRWYDNTVYFLTKNNVRMVLKETNRPWEPKFDKHEELSQQDIAFVKWLYASTPFVKTAGVSNVSENAAVFAGNVTNDGGSAITERGFCWNNTGNPSIEDDRVKVETGLSHFSDEIKDLQSNTTYFVKAYAKNSKGISYGNEITFTTYTDYSSPIVTTNPVEYEIELNENGEIENVTVYCGGDVTSNGGLEIQARGVCWNLTGNPNNSDKKYLDSNNTIGSFTLDITDSLNVIGAPGDINTTYYLKAFATNQKGTSYGNEISFNHVYLDSYLPIIITGEISEINQTSAIFRGEILNTEAATINSAGFCWNTSGNPSVRNDKETNVLNGNIFSGNITGLIPNTTYYVRTFANIDVEISGEMKNITIYGNQATFSTLPIAQPAINTSPAKGITTTEATLNGEIISDNGAPISQRGFYWSATDQTPDANDNKEIVSGTTGNFSKTISGLQPNTTYYFRAFATNGQGTTTGDVLSFKTTQELSLPTVQTNAVTSVTSNSGTLNGNVTSDGNSTITQRGFYWSETDNTPDSGDNKETVSGTTGSFTKTISGLQPNKTYYFRAFATNNKGTTTGDVLSFKTKQELSLPTVQTNAATDISTSSGTLNGNVTSDGNATITQRGFYWSETDNTPDSGDNKEIVSGTTGTYSKTISSLQANTTYYYCAFATNSEGTATGEVLSFKTLDEQGSETGTFTDPRDGNTYKWVKIGEQVWMAENLAYLPEVSPPELENASYTDPYYYVYNYLGSNVTEAKETNIYKRNGVLYNGAAALNACPEGWHLPSDSEWEQLAEYVSEKKGPYSKTDGGDWIDLGKHLKSQTGWEFSYGSDDFGFNSIPSGFIVSGSFTQLNDYVSYWSSSLYSGPSEFAIQYKYRHLRDGRYSPSADVFYFGHAYSTVGFSVRCIKD